MLGAGFAVKSCHFAGLGFLRAAVAFREGVGGGERFLDVGEDFIGHLSHWLDDPLNTRDLLRYPRMQDYLVVREGGLSCHQPCLERKNTH